MRYYFFLLFFCYNFYAQNITSRLVNPDGEAVVRGTILLQKSNNQILKYTSSSENGSFEFKDLQDSFDQTFLVVQAFGFEKKQFTIDSSKENFGIKKQIVLPYKSEVLEELSIKVNRPITVKKDTVVYKVKEFLKGDERVVEELLKNLPGITVSTDGTIKVGNTEIEKVMVDGSDFFERGYKVLTKNMPVKPIDEVELLQNYSHNKHLKGIEEGGKAALNLKLLEDAKSVWFGNAEAGAGYDEKTLHLLRTNLMNFGKKWKFYFLVNSNNISYDASGDLNTLIKSNLTNLNSNPSAPSLLNISEIKPGLSNHRFKDNNDKLFSVNSIFTPNKKLSIKISGLLNKDRLFGNKNIDEVLFDGDLTYQNKETTVFNQKKTLSFLRLDISYDLANNKMLNYMAKWNQLEGLTKGGLEYNENKSAQKLRDANQYFEQSLEYTQKLSKQEVLIVSGKTVYDNKNQDYKLVPNLYLDNSFDNTFFNQDVFSELNYAGIKANYFNRFANNNLLEIVVGNNFTDTHLRSDAENAPEFLSGNFKNELIYKTNEFYTTAKYLFTFDKFGIAPDFGIYYLNNQLKNNSESNFDAVLRIKPNLFLNWKPNEKHELKLFYKYGFTNAPVEKLFDSYIQTSFRNFVKGTAKLEQFTSSSVGLTYMLGNYSDRVFANLLLSYSKYNDFYSSDNYLFSNFTLNNSMIVHNTESYFFNGSVDYYFEKLKSNVRFLFGGNQSDFFNSLNGSDLRKIKSSSLNYGVEVKSVFKSFFNYSINSVWYNNTIKSDEKTNFIDNETTIGVKFKIKKQFYLNLREEIYSFGGVSDKRQFHNFLDLDLSFIPEKIKWNFRFQLNNLFNQKYYSTYSITDFSHTATTVKLLPRQVLFTINYSF